MTSPAVETWATLAKDHWREHRPKMFRELRRAGTLDELATSAAESALDLYATLVRSGMPAFEAREMALREYILLPG